MYQYYVIEIQKYRDGTYGHLVHYVYDSDETTAFLKGESKYYQILAAAAVSDLPQHSAILIDTKGNPIYHKCYEH